MLFWVQCRNPAILPPNDNIRIVKLEPDDENFHIPKRECVELFGGEVSDWGVWHGPQFAPIHEVRADGMLVYARDIDLPHWPRRKGDEVLSHG